VSYSTIQERSGIEDNGRFNYHLDKLRGHFLTEVERGYQLLPAGWRVLETLQAGVFTDHVHTEKVEIDYDCPTCGTPAHAWYRDNEVVVRCLDCPRNVTRMAFPPRRVQNREFRDVLAAYSVKKQTWNTLARRGVCVYCGDRARNTVDPDEEWVHADPAAVMTCEGCGGRFYTCVAERLLTHPAVVSFFYDNGTDIYDRPYWTVSACVEEPSSVVSEDPLEVRLVYTADEEELWLLVGKELNIIEQERVPAGTAAPNR